MWAGIPACHHRDAGKAVNRTFSHSMYFKTYRAVPQICENKVTNFNYISANTIKMIDMLLLEILIVQKCFHMKDPHQFKGTNLLLLQ